jgi:hypothetical protein
MSTVDHAPRALPKRPSHPRLTRRDDRDAPLSVKRDGGDYISDFLNTSSSISDNLNLSQPCP